MAQDDIRKDLAAQPKAQYPRGMGKALENAMGIQGLVDRNPWTHRVFFDFITAVGDSQRTVLALLVRQTRATDSQLREAVGVSTNQQLAGVLSGVSKQAAAFDLPARAVFTIENESKSGETMPWCITLDNSKGISRLRFWAKNSRVNGINDLPVFMHQGTQELDL